MTEKWGIQEAINRVCEAKTGSLVSNKITLEYLFKLLGKVDAWRDEIKEAIQMWPDSSSDEERALEKAEEMSQANPGQAFYVAEVYTKVITPVKPSPEYIRLI